MDRLTFTIGLDLSAGHLDNLGQVDVLDRVLHTNKEFLKSWQYTVHKGYTTPDYPVDKALATTEKPLPA